ncbi:MAG TPA: GNAT family N-acetyltransferase [Blastocatellia bacterium]|jgi:ribosomal protein S18 acetylase RimI-like enzyme|nr:GNAT family N-acetyltransferase [Blastocatellia bacterium]
MIHPHHWMNMEVRRLENPDAALARDAIATLKMADSSLRSNLNADYLRHFLSRPENYLIVATDGDRPVGYLVAYLLDRVDRDQAMMFFYEISVAESHHRRGAGTAMIDLLKSFCRQQNVMKMWVHTNRSNKAAMRLYESMGGEADASGDEITFLFTPESYGK